MMKSLQTLSLFVLTLTSSNSFGDEVCGHISEIIGKSSSATAGFQIEIDSQMYSGVLGETVMPIATTAFSLNRPVCIRLNKRTKEIAAISLKR